MRPDVRYKKLPEVAQVMDSLHVTPEYTEEGLPIVRPMNLQKGNLSLAECKKVSQETFARYTRKHVPAKGEIVMSRIGAADGTGSYTSVTFSYVNSDAPFCLGQNTAIILPRIDSLYLYYCLISRNVQSQLRTRMGGSTVKTIGLKSLNLVEIPIYPQETMEQICSILRVLHEKITINEQLNAKLAEMAELIAVYPESIF